jgi:hypothetical protein
MPGASPSKMLCKMICLLTFNGEIHDEMEGAMILNGTCRDGYEV